MTLQTIPLPDGETLAFITLYGANRSPEVTAWHQRVIAHFGWQGGWNYIEAPFHMGMSHGFAMNQLLQEHALGPNPPTYIAFCDNDNIPMRGAALDSMVQSVRNKVTVYGCAWQSSHKVGPNGTVQHAYASQACMCFPSALYRALGVPNCDHFNPRSDTAEEITYEAQARGYQLSLLYPSHSEEKTVALDNGCSYGHSVTYGPNLWFHETRADLPGASDRFVAMAQRVIAGEFDA